MFHKARIALITGAGSGIGSATAITFMQAGYHVVLTGRRMQALQETVELAGEATGQGVCIPADVQDPASVDALFSALIARFGRLDVVFNNAGVNAPAGVLLEDLAFADWMKVVQTNLTGPFLCTQAAFRVMKAQNPRGGRIINNGSVSSHAPRPNSAAYTATKHAITGLTKTASLDGRKYDIAVGQIDIGNALTDMARAMTKGVPQADGSIRIEDTIDVQVVADAVLHMAGLPLGANILTMTVMASNMPFVGRG